MGDLQVAIGTGGLDPKKHGCCLDLRLATISLYKKQCQSDKKPNNLHYIFESEVPQSPAEPLQNLIVQKKIAATCRRWLGVSYWVNGFLATFVVGVAAAIVAGIQTDLRTHAAFSLIVFTLATIASIWQGLGIWRSASNHFSRGGTHFW